MSLHIEREVEVLTGLIGREEVLRAVGSFLKSVATGPAALVISGEPGIGKTSVWDAAVSLAQAEGYELLTCRSAVSEASLSFAGLSDLVASVDGAMLDILPAPQRRALDVALLRVDPVGAPPSQLAISLACLGLAVSLASERQLLIAVDDAQWLDVATANVLEFLARRAGDLHIGFLVAVRSGIDTLPLQLGRSFANEIRSLELGPLGFSELFRVLRAHIGESFSRPTLRKIEEVSGGNPFFALEIGRALARSGAGFGPESELPVPASLQQLVEERLGRLPETSLHVLAFASAAMEPTADFVACAMGRSREEIVAALAPARALGIAEIRAGIVTFDHPLLAAAAWSRWDHAVHEAIYRALAEATDEPEARARYLVHVEPLPDEDVAAIFEAGALRAARRGAHDAAAELWQLAVDLTPTHRVDRVRRRRLELAEALLLTGDTDGAAGLLEKLGGSTEPGPDRARVFLRLAKLRYEQRNAQEALACCDRAVRKPATMRNSSPRSGSAPPMSTMTTWSEEQSMRARRSRSST